MKSFHFVASLLVLRSAVATPLDFYLDDNGNGVTMFSALLDLSPVASSNYTDLSGGTVFAPSNTFFSGSFSEEYDMLFNSQNADIVLDILLLHVSNIAKYPFATIPGEIITMQGENLTVTSIAGPSFTVQGGGNSGAATRVSSFDLSSGNIIHTIDGILLPSSIDATSMGAALEGGSTNISGGAADTYTVLATLADRLGIDLLTSFNTSIGPTTLFAPTDAAFETLLDSLLDRFEMDTTSLTDAVEKLDELLELDDSIPILFRSVLLLHFAEGVTTFSDLVSVSTTFQTLANVDTVLDQPGDAFLTYGTSGGKGFVTKFDQFRAVNGIVHTIDGVALPPDFETSIAPFIPSTAPQTAASLVWALALVGSVMYFL